MNVAEDFSEAVARGRLSAAANVVLGALAPPEPEDVVDLPPPGSAEHAAAEAAGTAALSRGEVAVVVLGGGMATRFGGAVKATVPVLDGQTFLEIKLRQAQAAADRYGGAVPVAVMTGWATHEPIRAHVAELGLPEPFLFQQGFALRLTPDGEVFRTGDGEVSPYPTGHGELPGALVRSGVLDRLRGSGVRHLLISNLDNLLARPDPLVVGSHLLRGRRVSVEVVRPPNPASSGARVVRLDGRPLLLDAAELGGRAELLPPLPLNTNTFILDTDVTDDDLPLPWRYYEKDVEGRVAVQIECPLHHLATLLPAAFLGVSERRFLPLKTRAEMVRHEAVLRTALEDLHGTH
ncbi:UTP--glucose-1-phosphate uridylyltransferase [Actinospica sp. MGRD01-02]|uniref:UTP--glucose-1-phosphate uridylyltransferase n=1 Tax=Actinospica acidithermotolerans TaxID=2828514 RepID=A0A941E6G1_9ACTN|nr:UTP--glucose-1-phosphate uridylyltransferase [Actinospica acidithermotolerans]MBR7825996.1 UTP--glucose-1-phosphate uridylyltransferase [Actinospica acidithermotolerans]